MKKHILVCGGAGYIGSQMCKRLAQAGYAPVAFDNLSTGHRWAVRWGPLIEGDLLDPDALARAFQEHTIHSVMHFAAKSVVSDSVVAPAAYYQTNVIGTLNLLEAMRTAGVERLVFSSTAAVYGEPSRVPIEEDHATQPLNPYGWSKLMAERMVSDYCTAYGFRAISLRYFNAAGADRDGETGEAHDPETHLIPSLLQATFCSFPQAALIYGDDYPTEDGTCIRDYLHVEDLCAAHLLALDHLDSYGGYDVFNLGTGRGHSVMEVVAACQALCGGKPGIKMERRRPGDPAILVASAERAKALLGWQPQLSLADCVSSALLWMRRGLFEQ